MKLSDITNLIFDRIMQNGWQGKIVSIEHQSDLETEIEAHQKSLLDEELYKACPTDAIRSDRFLVYAERCITFHNERPRDFPQWLDPSWHYSLVGYMICQNVCPINQKLLNWIEAAAASLMSTLPPIFRPEILYPLMRLEQATFHIRQFRHYLKYPAGFHFTRGG